MKTRFLCAALAAAAAAIWLAPPAEAGCVISPDQKSINVVTDNGASEEKNCAVKCQVDTKVGVVQIGCGGNTPPLAKGHSLCDFDKPDAYYKKVISFEDTCKGGAVPAATKASAPAPAKADGFSCRVSADGKTVDAMIANPYAIETSCQVNCQVSTTQAGTTFGVSCSKTVAPGVGEVVLCTQTFDKGKLVKMVSGNGNCIKPLSPDDAAAKDKDDDDDDDDAQNLDPAKLRAKIRKQLDPDAQKMFDKMNKP
jgi:hypothetical protein